MRSLFFLIAAILISISAPAAAADSAVFLVYHRFGEDSYPSTNVRIEQFEAHIRELVQGPYNVMPVGDILDALRNGRELPDRTVGITVDDAYLSVYTEAWPRLKAAGLPFTLFVATDALDEGHAGMLDWSQIREMHRAGVEIGAHTSSHLHMADSAAEKNRAEIEQSLKRFEEELGERPSLFAYPYGEAGSTEQTIVREFGFAAAFGQHSGVAYSGSDMTYLPRFALNENYSEQSDFRLRINALPLPVTDVLPADNVVQGNNPPSVGFSVADRVGSLANLACYHSQFGRVETEILGTHRVEVRFPEPFAAGRSRLNCTLPAGNARWRWFGLQYYAPSG